MILSNQPSLEILTSALQVQTNTDPTKIPGAVAVKNLFETLSKRLSTLNEDIAGYSFGETPDGQPGFRKPGADTVIPFTNLKDLNVSVVGSLESSNIGYGASWTTIENLGWKTINILEIKGVSGQINFWTEPFAGGTNMGGYKVASVGQEFPIPQDSKSIQFYAKSATIRATLST